MRKHMIEKLVILFLLSFVPLTATEKLVTTSKEKDIRELFVLTNSAQLGIQAMQQMMAYMQQAMPDVPKKFWKEFMKEVHPDDLIDLLIPIYNKHYNHKEIKDLIEFYKTPTGQKLIKTSPQVTQESMMAGKKWGEQLAKKAIEKIKKEYRKQ